MPAPRRLEALHDVLDSEAGMTRERPIIMTAESVRAILAGRKTQTRRIARHLPAYKKQRRQEQEAAILLGCPYGLVGDRLWVREAWSHDACDLDTCRVQHEDAMLGIGSGPYYRATEVSPDTLRWISPLFMPRWASRITLEITEVSVQRLHEISEEDARAEGVEPYTPPHGHISPDQRVPGPGFDRCRLGDQPHRLPFADRWDAINGKRRRREYLEIGHPDRRSDRPWRTVVDESAAWAANPWVWAITFRRLEVRR